MIQAQSAVSVSAVPSQKNTNKSTATSSSSLSTAATTEGFLGSLSNNHHTDTHTQTHPPRFNNDGAAVKVQVQVNPINLNLTQEQELTLLDIAIQLSIVSHSKAAFERAKSLIAQYNQLAARPYPLPDFSVILALKAQYGGMWAAYYHKTLSTPPTSSSLPSSRSPLDASSIFPATTPTISSNREHGGSGKVEEFQEASGKVAGDGERNGDYPYPSPRPAITSSREAKSETEESSPTQFQPQQLDPRLAQADLEKAAKGGATGEADPPHPTNVSNTAPTSGGTTTTQDKLRKYLSTQPRLVLDIDASNVAIPAKAKEYVNGAIAEELWSLISAKYGEQARYLVHFAAQFISNSNTVPAGPSTTTFPSTVPASAGVSLTLDLLSERLRLDDLSGPMLNTCTRIVSIYLALWDCPPFLRWATTTTTTQNQDQGDGEVSQSLVFATLGVRRLQALLGVGTSHLTRCLAWLEAHVFVVGKVQPARLALAGRQQNELGQQLSFDLLDLRGQNLGRVDDSATLTSTLTSTSSGDTTSVIKSGTTSDPAPLSSVTLLKSGTAGSVTTTTTSDTAGASAILDLEAAIPATAAVEATAKATARVSKRNTATLLNTHSDVSPLELEIPYSDYQHLLAILSGTLVGQSQTQTSQPGSEGDNEYVISSKTKKRRVGRTIQTSNQFYGLREELAALLDHYPKRGSLGPVITPQQFAWLYSAGINSNPTSATVERRRRKRIKSVALSSEQSVTTSHNNSSKHKRPTSSVSLPAQQESVALIRTSTQQEIQEVTQQRVALVAGLSREVTLRLQVGRSSSATPARPVLLARPVTLEKSKVVSPLCSPVTLKTLKVVPLCQVVTLENLKVVSPAHIVTLENPKVVPLPNQSSVTQPASAVPHDDHDFKIHDDEEKPRTALHRAINANKNNNIQPAIPSNTLTHHQSLSPLLLIPLKERTEPAEEGSLVTDWQGQEQETQQNQNQNQGQPVSHPNKEEGSGAGSEVAQPAPGFVVSSSTTAPAPGFDPDLAVLELFLVELGQNLAQARSSRGQSAFTWLSSFSQHRLITQYHSNTELLCTNGLLVLYQSAVGQKMIKNPAAYFSTALEEDYFTQNPQWFSEIQALTLTALPTQADSFTPSSPVLTSSATTTDVSSGGIKWSQSVLALLNQVMSKVVAASAVEQLEESLPFTTTDNGSPVPATSINEVSTSTRGKPTTTSARSLSVKKQQPQPQPKERTRTFARAGSNPKKQSYPYAAQLVQSQSQQQSDEQSPSSTEPGEARAVRHTPGADYGEVSQEQQSSVTQRSSSSLALTSPSLAAVVDERSTGARNEAGSGTLAAEAGIEAGAGVEVGEVGVAEATLNQWWAEALEKVAGRPGLERVSDLVRDGRLTLATPQPQSRHSYRSQELAAQSELGLVSGVLPLPLPLPLGLVLILPYVWQARGLQISERTSLEMIVRQRADRPVKLDFRCLEDLNER